MARNIDDIVKSVISKVPSVPVGKPVDGAPRILQPQQPNEGSDYNVVELIKAMANVNGYAYTPRGQQVLQKALNESTDSEGGYLVPPGFIAQVIERKQALITLAGMVYRQPVTVNKGEIPSLTADVTITWGAETANIAETNPEFGQITWNAHRASALVKVSRDLLEDSGIDLEAYLAKLFAEAIAREEDRVIVMGQGDSQNQPLGLYYATGITEVALGGALTYEALVELEHSVDARYRENCVWIMNNNNVKRARKLKDGSGAYIFVRGRDTGSGDFTAKAVDRLLGYPIAEVNALPDHTIIFGDPNYYWLFERRSFEIESSTHGDAFVAHQLWLKVTFRTDGKPMLSEAWAKMTGITG